MDAVASVASDFVCSSEKWPTLVNVVHPRPITWRNVMSDINANLKRQLKLVPFNEWLTALETIAAKGTVQDVERLVGLESLL